MELILLFILGMIAGGLLTFIIFDNLHNGDLDESYRRGYRDGKDFKKENNRDLFYQA